MSQKQVSKRWVPLAQASSGSLSQANRVDRITIALTELIVKEQKAG